MADTSGLVIAFTHHGSLLDAATGLQAEGPALILPRPQPLCQRRPHPGRLELVRLRRHRSSHLRRPLRPLPTRPPPKRRHAQLRQASGKVNSFLVPRQFFKEPTHCTQPPTRKQFTTFSSFHPRLETQKMTGRASAFQAVISRIRQEIRPACRAANGWRPHAGDRHRLAEPSIERSAQVRSAFSSSP